MAATAQAACGDVGLVIPLRLAVEYDHPPHQARQGARTALQCLQEMDKGLRQSRVATSAARTGPFVGLRTRLCPLGQQGQRLLPAGPELRVLLLQEAQDGRRFLGLVLQEILD